MRKQADKAARYNDFYMSVAMNAASLSHYMKARHSKELAKQTG